MAPRVTLPHAHGASNVISIKRGRGEAAHIDAPAGARATRFPETLEKVQTPPTGQPPAGARSVANASDPANSHGSVERLLAGRVNSKQGQGPYDPAVTAAREAVMWAVRAGIKFPV